MSNIRLTVKIAAVDAIAERVLAFSLVTTDAKPLPSFTPGAHIDVHLEHGITRQYSLCGTPEQAANGEYRIAVLQEEESRGGSSHIHTQWRVGQTVEIGEPRNHFHLDEAFDGRYLLIAGGIGITPILAMAHRLQALNKDYELIYLAKAPASAAYYSDLQTQHGNRLKAHFSRAEGQRRLDLDDLMRCQSEATQIYFCGAENLLQAVLEASRDCANIHVSFERFSAVSDENSGPNNAFDIEISSTGECLRVEENESILSVLKRSGHAIESSCEEGLCGSCEVGLLSGEADHRDSVLDDDEKAEQSVLMVCCSRARSQRLVLDL